MTVPSMPPAGVSLAERLNRDAPPRGMARPGDPRNPANLPKLSNELSHLDGYTRQFVDTMREETFQQSLSRFYDFSELTNVPMAVNSGLMPTDFAAGDRIARTRRFAKAAFYIADPTHPVGDSIAMVSQSIDDYLATRDLLRKQALDLLRREPGYLAPTHPDHAMNELGEIIGGHGLMGSDPEKIPPSIRGTQRGLLVDSMLLGLTGDQGAINPLLKLADATMQDSFQQDISTELKNAWSKDRAKDVGVMNIAYIADALDRILSNRGDPRNAAYIAWRQTQTFPQRQSLLLYPYDSARSPYDLAGALAGPQAGSTSDAPPTLTYATPGILVQGSEWPREQIQKIIEFARAVAR